MKQSILVQLGDIADASIMFACAQTRLPHAVMASWGMDYAEFEALCAEIRAAAKARSKAEPKLCDHDCYPPCNPSSTGKCGDECD